MTSVTIGNNTVTETIAPSYSGERNLTSTTTNVQTGASTSETFSGLVITGASQSVVAALTPPSRI